MKKIKKMRKLKLFKNTIIKIMILFHFHKLMNIFTQEINRLVNIYKINI